MFALSSATRCDRAQSRMLRTRKYLTPIAPLTAPALFAPTVLADHPDPPQGFGSERAYLQILNLLDQVNLPSGHLSVSLPVGPFTLVYSNNPRQGGGALL